MPTSPASSVLQCGRVTRSTFLDCDMDAGSTHASTHDAVTSSNCTHPTQHLDSLSELTSGPISKSAQFTRRNSHFTKYSSFVDLRTDSGSGVVQSTAQQTRILFTPATSDSQTSVDLDETLQITCPDDFSECNYKCKTAYGYDPSKMEACMEAVAQEFRIGSRNKSIPGRMANFAGQNAGTIAAGGVAFLVVGGAVQWVLGGRK